MAMLTFGTAAQATGTAKSTILRAIKGGRMTATRAPTRVVVPLVPGATEHDATTDILVAELRQVIQDLRRGQDDLRQERDHWRTALEREQAAHAATQRLLLPALEREQAATQRLLLPAPATIGESGPVRAAAPAGPGPA
jgi:hypothetical protein